MNGQWMGKYNGSNEGLIIVNIDEGRSYFEGIAFLNESNPALPTVVAGFKTENKNKRFRLRTGVILPINPKTALIDSWENVKSLYDEQVGISEYADVDGNWNKNFLKLSWTTSIGTYGSCNLPKSKADQPSEYIPVNKNWTEYKKYVSRLESRRYIFRGQNKPWRLRTSFHRTGRANLLKFLNEDIQMLHRHLSSRTRHAFNLEIPNENGAFFNLIQHHGYPTPLLDWTYSPYVAAFFAYRGISNNAADSAKQNDKVRILIFDQERWKIDFNQIQRIVIPGPHVSILEFLSIENERMIPQQAVSMLTSIDDIESYIKSRETNEKKFLQVIDLPVKERKNVVEELSYMGITAGALFPGLDGACEELKERNFKR
jgi:hypothetical protein